MLASEQAPLDALLERNIGSNFAAERAAGRIAACELDWEEPGDVRARVCAALDGATPDLVLISDCIYSGLYGDSWKSLARVLDAVVDRPAVRVLNCVERRAVDGVDEFNTLCKSMGFAVRRLRAETLDQDEQIELYEMYRSPGRPLP